MYETVQLDLADDRTLVAERRLGLTPLRRVGTMSQVASTDLLLAADASSFITGQTIVVDGGTLITDGNRKRDTT